MSTAVAPTTIEKAIRRDTSLETLGALKPASR
jgi:hypothetical protein